MSKVSENIYTAGFSFIRDIYYLILVSNRKNKRVYFSEDFKNNQIHSGINRHTSPLFPIKLDFSGTTKKTFTIHFFYVNNPINCFNTIAKLVETTKVNIFLTHGNAEIICMHSSSNNSAIMKKINELNDNKNIAVETWQVCDNVLVSENTATFENNKETLDCSILSALIPNEANYLQREVYSLLFRRTDGVSNLLQNESPSTQSYIDNLCISLGVNENHENHKYSELWKFTGVHTYSVSQRFTCTSPLNSTPCSLGGHELLGVGKSLRAIKQFGSFIFRCFSDAKLAEQIELFLANDEKVISFSIPDSLEHGAKKLSNDLIKLRDFSNIDQELQVNLLDNNSATTTQKENPAIPLIHYFNTVYGFQFDGMGISIPLQTISCGNTLQWSLMSLTHEYCHIITDFFLAGARKYMSENNHENFYKVIDELYHDLSDTKVDVITFKGNSLLDLFTKVLIYPSINEFDKSTAIKSASKLSKADFKFENEIITLIFDFYYFFKGDIKQHLTMYWSHWLNLPGVKTSKKKIEKFLVRSCCAIILALLDDSDNNINSLSPCDVMDSLKDVLHNSNIPKIEVIQIIEIMEDAEVKGYISYDIRGYLPLVCTVKSLLVSSSIKETLWEGSENVAANNLNEWRKTLRVEYGLLGNAYHPLQLMHIASLDQRPNEIESQWLFTILDTITYEK